MTIDEQEIDHKIDDHDLEECIECGGTGSVWITVAQAGDQTLEEEYACNNCSGSGLVERGRDK